MIVGDLNLAATSKDVHPSMDWAKMYHPEEIAAFRALQAELSDVWRLQNPEATDCFTVWDEKTSARSVNRVSSHKLWYKEERIFTVRLQPHLADWIEGGFKVHLTFLGFLPNLLLSQESSPGTHKAHNCKYVGAG